MNWERLVLGRRSDAFGAAKWPLLAVAGVLIAVFSAMSGDWLYVAIGAGIALVGGAITARGIIR